MSFLFPVSYNKHTACSYYSSDVHTSRNDTHSNYSLCVTWPQNHYFTSMDTYNIYYDTPKSNLDLRNQKETFWHFYFFLSLFFFYNNNQPSVPTRTILSVIPIHVRTLGPYRDIKTSTYTHSHYTSGLRL